MQKTEKCRRCGIRVKPADLVEVPTPRGPRRLCGDCRTEPLFIDRRRPRREDLVDLPPHNYHWQRLSKQQMD